MDELFSCRNCIHNCGQSLLIGRGAGFCVRHDSVLFRPERYTCKYLHRKDLPMFTVDEGLREHAGEFAGFSGIVDLIENQPVRRLPYSEKFAWERNQFDPITQSLAQYHKTKPSWIFLQTMTGGIDGRRSLTQASLFRRYMDNCGTWRSSYRFALELVQELSSDVYFADRDMNSDAEGPLSEIKAEAVWDVFFTRLSGIQEYGYHAGIEDLMWAPDQLNGALLVFDWESLRFELESKVSEWTEVIIRHAKSEDAFFPSFQEPVDPEEEAYTQAREQLT
jgi:hypothetical protein